MLCCIDQFEKLYKLHWHPSIFLWFVAITFVWHTLIKVLPLSMPKYTLVAYLFRSQRLKHSFHRMTHRLLASRDSTGEAVKNCWVGFQIKSSYLQWKSCFNIRCFEDLAYKRRAKKLTFYFFDLVGEQVLGLSQFMLPIHLEVSAGCTLLRPRRPKWGRTFRPKMLELDLQ